MRFPIDPVLMSQVRAVLNSRGLRARPEARDRLRLVRNAQTDGGPHAEMWIYDEISYYGITAQDVAATLADVTGDLTVRLNSPGGDVFDGIAIYNLLGEHPGHVTITVDGLAASAASFIAQAGDTIVMNRASQMMIHDAIGLCMGNAADMTETAGMLERISDTLAGIYAARADGSAKTWRRQMQAETWYTADEAVTAGLADRVAAKTTRQATSNAYDLSVFRYAGRQEAPAPDVVDTAAAVHHTATTAGAWDGPAAEKAMPAEAATLKYCHAWRNSDGDPDAKGTYKFPHHRSEGGPANLAACRNGLARLPGADIPDADRAGVEAHLRAHLNDAGDTEDHAAPLTADDLKTYDPAVMKAALTRAADGFEFDPDGFRTAVAQAAGFDLDPDLFKAAIELHSGNAPAASVSAEPATTQQDDYDATRITRAIREAIR